MAVPDSSPPPPTGAITMSRSGHVVEQLERGRALPGDDARVVERMDQRRAGLALHLGARRLARGDVSARRSGSSRRSGARSPASPSPRSRASRPTPRMPRRARRVRERRAVVARRMRDDAAPRLARPTARTRRCVAPRALNAPTFWKFSHLKKSARARFRVDRAAGEHRRAMHVRRDARVRRADRREIGKRERVAPVRASSGISFPQRRGCSGRTGPSTSRASP